MILYCLYLVILCYWKKWRSPKIKYKTVFKPSVKSRFKSNKKPQWVIDKIIYFKAIMPKISGYKITDIFNRQFGHRETVSKSFVYGVIKKHQYAIALKRKDIKNKKPYPVLINKIWGIDLTGKHDSEGENKHILGIIDHGSRFNIVLKYLEIKQSKRLLFEIYRAVKIYGKPSIIRTDNEPVFKSRIFKLGLRLLNIQHQTTDICCPWQNGRIERFFGTLKEKLNLLNITDSGHLDWHLNDFRFWYNHVRTHMNLDGRTPIEVWQGKGIKRHAEFYSAWDGLLQGYLHPLDG